jgi:titin
VITLHGPVTGLHNGTTYTILVRAENDAAGAGPESLDIEVTPVASVTVPGAPRNLHATPKDHAARLWWTPPLSNGGAPVRGYQVDLHGNGTWMDLVISAAPHGERTAVISGLRNGGTYKPRVRAVNRIGVGAPSATTRVKPPTG